MVRASLIFITLLTRLRGRFAISASHFGEYTTWTEIGRKSTVKGKRGDGLPTRRPRHLFETAPATLRKALDDQGITRAIETCLNTIFISDAVQPRGMHTNTCSIYLVEEEKGTCKIVRLRERMPFPEREGKFQNPRSAVVYGNRP